VDVTGRPLPDDDAALQAARWCGRIAEVLGDVGRRVAQLGEQVARDWPDDHGREWAQRTAEIRGSLGREAVAAAELGEAYSRQAAASDGPDPAGAPLPTVPGGLASRRTGMRLGGTDAVRVEDERGMRIAELDTPPSPG
jgi:hypothetical protein